jgi:plastocyanin
MFRASSLLLTFVAFAFQSLPAHSQTTEITISVKDNKFDPVEVEAPADTPIRFRIKNLDAKPMEFESKSLKFEKIVTGGGEATVNVRAQRPGRYEFYDDFHEDTTRGFLNVK